MQKWVSDLPCSRLLALSITYQTNPEESLPADVPIDYLLLVEVDRIFWSPRRVWPSRFSVHYQWGRGEETWLDKVGAKLSHESSIQRRHGCVFKRFQISSLEPVFKPFQFSQKICFHHGHVEGPLDRHVCMLAWPFGYTHTHTHTHILTGILTHRHTLMHKHTHTHTGTHTHSQAHINA